MDVRELTATEKVDILINQIANHFDDVFYEQILNMEDSFGGQGTWIIQESFCNPDAIDLIGEIENELDSFESPDVFNMLTFVLRKYNLEHSLSGYSWPEISFNDQNALEAITGCDIAEIIFVKISNKSLQESFASIEHYIDNLNRNTFDSHAKTWFNEDNDLYVFHEEDGYGLWLDSIDSVIAFVKEYDKHEKDVQGIE